MVAADGTSDAPVRRRLNSSASLTFMGSISIDSHHSDPLWPMVDLAEHRHRVSEQTITFDTLKSQYFHPSLTIALRDLWQRNNFSKHRHYLGSGMISLSLGQFRDVWRDCRPIRLRWVRHIYANSAQSGSAPRRKRIKTTSRTTSV